MAIQLFYNLSKVIYSPFSDPKENPAKVEKNILVLTGLYTSFAGSSAIVLAILKKSLKEGSLSTLTSSLLKVSLFTGATSTAILACAAYNYKRSEPSNENTLRFERATCHAAMVGVATIVVARTLFKGNKHVITIADRCYHYFNIPFLLCGITAVAINYYHADQFNRAEKINH